MARDTVSHGQSDTVVSKQKFPSSRGAGSRKSGVGSRETRGTRGTREQGAHEQGAEGKRGRVGEGE
ncbi:hypothetical protein [Chroococcidiopsis sp. CCNUC1]|uniref:hypothetical protein n=1 Tax=Chroococcidiopsis sp. CCNUC1 TaxID=2653189 RepID=UPI002021AF46|nr:hypothetical protein [Chroococcidiopsis sp. CCNUC1]URD51740.1 hypothetical protein M5J74_07040 [Chroococcidiopsis sp. CCNUC1]